MNKETVSFIEGLNMQNPEAYRQLYNLYYKVLVLYAMNFNLPIEAAEDIVQTLFISIWEKKNVFKSLDSFHSYLYNSVRNSSFNYLKHENVEQEYLEKMAHTHQVLDEDEVQKEEVYRLLFQTIDRLPPRCREIFLLYMDGKKNEEIAVQLSISIETVKTQKKRAIKFIKEQIGPVYCLMLYYDIMYHSKLFL